jgi:branched-chain amino acid transport system ATP-binding protein
VAETLLEVRQLAKRFGGVVATDNLSFEVHSGEVHALIGPNGAGKSTLVAQLAGSIAPDTGSIVFASRDISKLPQHERVRAGLARSFQVTSLFGRLSVLENLALAVQAREGSSFSFWRPVALERALDDEARSFAAEVGLESRLGVEARTLAHGEQRALEVALALATRPRLVLLDEPMAGMGAEDSRRMIELIARLRGQVTVLLVEHDMDAVFRLADRVSVLVNGRLIACAAPEAVRRDPEVRRAYLGELAA